MDTKFYVEYYELERNHWWFKARLHLLKTAIQTHTSAIPQKKLKILNVGAATGVTSQMLETFGDVTSLEYDKQCCIFLKEKTGIEAVNASLTDLPFKDSSFDVICGFDVVEHIEDDEKAIREINRVLTPNGQYFLTVPAFQFLWSNHDVVNHHFRRYTQKSFLSLLNSNGLNVSFSSYFNFWLFFPIATVRFILNLLPRKKSQQTSGSDNEILQSSSSLNSLLQHIFRTEKIFFKKRIKLPVGVSFFATGSKSS